MLTDQPLSTQLTPGPPYERVKWEAARAASGPGHQAELREVVSVDHFGGVLAHGPADVGRVEQPLVVHGELAQVTEVLDIEVGSEGADELGWFDRRGWRRCGGVPGGDRDARPCLTSTLSAPEVNLSLPSVTRMKISVVLVVHMLGRGQPGTCTDRLDHAQAVLGMGAVLEDAAEDRPAA